MALAVWSVANGNARRGNPVATHQVAWRQIGTARQQAACSSTPERRIVASVSRDVPRFGA
ncbi:hypothetical protein C7S16_6973 [Burkholderia thailandensis]|uniref:Uncharacterized protein n=1 Tax=Burkholderia thailandensis TaxID=57975 RepID=A0AAW9CRA5_BURTH|nr:hypothetical protein [Burkholderia thailandensis]MDW9253124.1 hypothetical protein [Burkholderia thailandensis]PJO69853.1 hypothetical protein CWD92_24285 [Burkholderia thailandensis]PNE78361.1 hypothetical protein A8H37_09315 [Burkholderia thailandensis]